MSAKTHAGQGHLHTRQTPIETRQGALQAQIPRTGYTCPGIPLQCPTGHERPACDMDNIPPANTPTPLHCAVCRYSSLPTSGPLPFGSMYRPPDGPVSLPPALPPPRGLAPVRGPHRPAEAPLCKGTGHVCKNHGKMPWQERGPML